jgi:hypothetical protein
VLFYRSQRSVSDVAAALGLSQDTVRQRLHRGRQLIKSEVASLVEDTLARSGPGKAFAVGVIAALPALITPPASAAVAGIAVKGAPAAKTLVGTGLTGAILTPILGLPGGIFGAWWSSKFNGSPHPTGALYGLRVRNRGRKLALSGLCGACEGLGVRRCDSRLRHPRLLRCHPSLHACPSTALTRPCPDGALEFRGWLLTAA